MPARPLALAVLLLATTLGAQQGTLTTQHPPCSVHQLTLTLDRGDGEFDGMQQSGARLVLRNISQDVCSVQPIPRPLLFDSGGRPLPVSPRLPGIRGMHPGPVVLPVPLAASATLTATMRWITGPVFNHNVFAKSKSLSLSIEGRQLRVPFEAEICGEQGKEITYSITRFTPDPTYKPSALTTEAARPPASKPPR